MKVNEAPEKLYLSKNIYSTYLYQVPDPDDETAIEYVRTDSLKKSWKPSDEQMKALWEAYKGGDEQAELAILYNDLKKLREV